MAIDFTLSPELEQLRLRVRDFVERVVKPGEAKIGNRDDIERAEYVKILIHMRQEAQNAGLWLPHMPRNGAAWGSATSSWPWSRPRRRSRRTARGC